MTSFDGKRMVYSKYVFPVRVGDKAALFICDDFKQEDKAGYEWLLAFATSNKLNVKQVDVIWLEEKKLNLKCGRGFRTAGTHGLSTQTTTHTDHATETVKDAPVMDTIVAQESKMLA